MNTFTIGLDSDDISFEYQAGSVKTTEAWVQPTKHILNKFVKTIPKIKNYGKYELFLVGGVVNGRIGETWDIDIIVCGEIIPKEFELFLHELYDIALNKFNILVDARWFNVPIYHFQYLIESGRKDKVNTVRFGHFRKKIGNKESVIDLFKNGKKISDYLVELEIVIPTNKALSSVVGNKYIKI